MDNSQITDPNIFPDTTVIGDTTTYPVETTNLNNTGIMPTHPNTIGTGVTRGDQTIAGSLTIANDDGTQTIIGKVPNSTTNQFGITLLDATGRPLKVIIGGTIYTYDPNNSYVNSIIDGILPDGTSGVVFAKPGIDASTLFT